MRIVNLATFRAMPEGTIFMKYEPCIFDTLSVKGETWEHDWTYANISYEIESTDSGDFAAKLEDAERNPSMSIPMDFDCYGRDGCFEDDQLFAVYDKADIEGLIAKLLKCKEDAYT